MRALEFRGAEFRPPEFGTMVSTGERSGGANSSDSEKMRFPSVRAFLAERWGKIVGNSRFCCLPSFGSGSAFGEGGLGACPAAPGLLQPWIWEPPCSGLRCGLAQGLLGCPRCRGGIGCRGGGVVPQLSDFNLLLQMSWSSQPPSAQPKIIAFLLHCFEFSPLNV